MDKIREKLVEILVEPCCGLYPASELADYLIEHGVTVQEWIPVTEPPKKDGRYYVNVKMHDISYVKIASFSKESVAGLHDNGWYEYDSDVGFYEVKDVTHWMPLPTPPKGDSV